MAQVALEHLSKVFAGPQGERIRAVDDASLTVEDRELLVVVGPSGCGKTTLLRLIAGLETPVAGTVAIAGQGMNGVAPKDREVAMVFQNPALYPHLTAAENIAFGLKLRKVPRAEIARRVGEAAEMLGLGECLERKPGALSGGQRQRVALGRALVRRPRVFLFDEPLSNLDAPMRAQMRAEIVKLHARLEATMIYVTHDQVEAMALGERIAVMRSGRFEQADAPLTVYRRPANLFVAGFLGAPPMNFFQGTLAATRDGFGFQAQAAGGGPGTNGFLLRLDPSAAAQLRDRSGKPMVLGVRPEDISVRLEAGDAAPDGAVAAVVERSEALGSETQVHLAAGGRKFVARMAGTTSVAVGQSVAAVFDMAHAHFFEPETGRALDQAASK